MKSSNTISKKLFGGLFVAVLSLCSISVTNAQIYVTDEFNNLVDEFNGNGVPVTSFSAGSGIGPGSIAISGSDLFVGEFTSNNGLVEEFSSSGTVINSSLISGVDPLAIAVSGSDLFLANGNTDTIQEYSLSGNTATLVASSAPPSSGTYIGLAISGSSLFATVNGFSTGAISQFSISGNAITSVNPTLIKPTNNSQFSSAITALTASGGNLYVAETTTTITNGIFSSNSTGIVDEYSTSGTLESQTPLVSQLNVAPAGLAVSGSDLFVLNQIDFKGSILGEYSTSGTAISVPLGHTPGNNYSGIALGSQFSPRPARDR